MSNSSILWGVLFGSLGAGYALYGKKQRALLVLLCGVALMVLPYFVPNPYGMVLLGVLLAAAPFVFK